VRGGAFSRRRRLLTQLIRFGVVGVANTAVYYALYRLLLLALPYLVAHVVAWVASVVFSYFANALFTYRVRPSLRTFLAYPSTTVANLAFTTGGSWLAVELFGADERYITVVMGIAAIPLTFLLTRWVLRVPSTGAPGGSDHPAAGRPAGGRLVRGDVET
jgi:putative flippase GtrA